MATILIADDEARMRKILSLALMDDGHEVIEAKDAEEAVKIIHSTSLSLIISDLRMPGGGGMLVLQTVQKLSQTLPVIILTAYGTINNAVEAVKCGAYDYLLKPCDLEEIKLTVHKALQAQHLELENRYLRKEVSDHQGWMELTGKSVRIREVIEQVRRIASGDRPLLIRGESGSGKEFIARLIHEQSSRSKAPFVKVNCAAIPADLLELELFGRMRGPGISTPSIGRFEVAYNGTLYLNEISDMPLRLQTKILRTLQEGIIEPVGGANTKKVNVRIIAGSSQNLEARVEEKTLHAELFYHLNPVTIQVPPLRERKEDIPLLIQHYLDKKQAKQKLQFTPEEIETFLNYSWPGNIRELINVIERALALETTDVNLLLPSVESLKTSSIFFNDGYKELLQLNYKEAKKNLLDQFERLYFANLLRITRGNVSRAAELSQVHRKNLHVKLNELGIDPREYADELEEQQQA